jgi:hypothetical protein
MSVYQATFPYGFGVFLAATIAYAARRMRSDELWFLTWLMGVVLAGFIGFPLEHGDLRAAGIEAAVLIGLGGLLAVSWLRRAAVVLAIVYLAHGASDVVHLRFDVSPANPRWLHEMCIPFDWLMGAYILARRSSLT